MFSILYALWKMFSQITIINCKSSSGEYQLLTLAAILMGVQKKQIFLANLFALCSEQSQLTKIFVSFLPIQIVVCIFVNFLKFTVYNHHEIQLKLRQNKVYSERNIQCHGGDDGNIILLTENWLVSATHQKYNIILLKVGNPEKMEAWGP